VLERRLDVGTALGRREEHGSAELSVRSHLVGDGSQHLIQHLARVAAGSIDAE
jgi:hypothetical protein